jgi:UrcA family protein
MKTLFALVLAAAALALSATPASAQAQDRGEGGQLLVSFADLDLSSERDARILDRRLRVAAELACGPISDFDPAGKNDVRECRAETLALARAQRDTLMASRRGGQEIAIAARP